MNIALHFLCFLGLVGLSFSDAQLPEQFLTESEFKDALAQLLVKIAESEQRMLQAQQTASSQLLTQIMDIVPLVSDLMQPKGSRKDKFFGAVEKGDENFVRLWIQNGFAVDETDPWALRENALHKAARSGNTSIVKTLLSVRANPDARRGDGKTPLHMAVEEGHIAVVDQLIQAGGDPNQKDVYGYTSLNHAVLLGKKEIAIQLIAAGANPNERNDLDGYTPLHEAVRGGQLELVEALLRAGASTASRDNEGKTPLEILPERNRSKISEILSAHKLL